MDATRLLAPGVPIVVAGGQVLVRFDLRALAALEASFGSIVEAEARLLQVVRSARPSDGTDPYAEPVVADLGLILAAATRMQPAQVLDGIDLTIEDTIDVLIEAWAQAWPAPDAEGKAEAPGTGAPSTGSRPSTADAPTTSSGT